MKTILFAALALFASPAAAQSVSGCGTAAILKADQSNVAKLTAGAECFEKVEGLASAAAQARRDRIAALAPPVAHEHPTPVATGWVASPTPEGGAPVASGLKVSDYLSPAWGTGVLPGPEAPGIEGAQRFICLPSHNAYDDPIVYPGQPGKSHLHTFFGNTAADANSTYDLLRTKGDSTCNTVLNRSAYWIAAMMNGQGKVVMPDWVSIYYKRAPKDSKFCAPPHAGRCDKLPRGLRYIFGYDMVAGKHDPGIFRWFNCDGPGAVSGHFATIAEAAKGCPVGARLGAVIVGPNCWDGKNLDSPDHRSHMAYQAYGDWGYARCPRTHPVLLPFFELAAWYTFDGGLWRLSSDIQMGTEGGKTFHADWWGAWEDSILDRWTANCIDKAASCSGGDIGDGWQQKQQPASAWEKPKVIDPPAKPR